MITELRYSVAQVAGTWRVVRTNIASGKSWTGSRVHPSRAAALARAHAYNAQVGRVWASREYRFAPTNR